MEALPIKLVLRAIAHIEAVKSEPDVSSPIRQSIGFEEMWCISPHRDRIDKTGVIIHRPHIRSINAVGRPSRSKAHRRNRAKTHSLHLPPKGLT